MGVSQNGAFQWQFTLPNEIEKYTGQSYVPYQWRWKYSDKKTFGFITAVNISVVW